jgi:hypothetical protein
MVSVVALTPESTGSNIGLARAHFVPEFLSKMILKEKARDECFSGFQSNPPLLRYS